MPAEAAVIPAEPADLMRPVERAEAEGERVIVTRDGNPVALVVWSGPPTLPTITHANARRPMLREKHHRMSRAN